MPLVDGAVVLDGHRWVRCTQHATLGCNWLADEEHDEFKKRGRCLADSLIRREPAADDTLAREKLVPTAAALRRLVHQLDDIGLPVDPFWRREGYYQNVLVETGSGAMPYLDDCRALFDWRWMSMFFNRVNTAMGKSPLYPFEIPPAVADKLGFVHRVIRQTAQAARD